MEEMCKGCKGYVYLVGAGPGDQGLMTAGGMEVLKKADVVLYDNLVSVSLLNAVNNEAQLIYTGKRSGRHSMTQEEINALIVAKAQEGNVVVRLKGGDPFVFGRGGEEALALKKHGIGYTVIPGVSSAYAVAAYAGIPVTHRGEASSFHVITGHEDETKAKNALDYAVLAKLEGTLVFLMGLKNLAHITHQLMLHGKGPETPAAVISRGTTSRQQMVVGTLENIQGLAYEKNIQTPAITVVGNVSSLHKILDWFGHQCLSGKSVLITATDEISRNISKKIQAFGAEPLALSLIHTKTCDGEAVSQAFKNIDDFSWIVLTSRNGVHSFFEQLKKYRIDMRRLARIRFAVIGHGTGQTLAKYGIYADCVPAANSSRHLGETLIPLLSKDDKVLLLRAAQASTELTDMLNSAGVHYAAAAIYETVVDIRKKELLNRVIGDADYITFCSPSAVKAFADMVENSNKSNYGKVICIGPVTARAARDLGVPVYKMAQQYDVDGLVQCMIEDSEKGDVIDGINTQTKKTSCQ